VAAFVVSTTTGVMGGTGEFIGGGCGRKTGEVIVDVLALVVLVVAVAVAVAVAAAGAAVVVVASTDGCCGCGSCCSIGDVMVDILATVIVSRTGDDN
jgi:hypothetical protein